MVSAKLYVLTLGRLYVDKGFALGSQYKGKTLATPILVYYIDHPEAKILVEVGLEPNFPGLMSFPQIPPYFTQSPEENLEGQLKIVGVKPDDIDYVIPSHLHPDHTGYLPIFAKKKAKILVQWAELRYAYAPEVFNTYAYCRQYFDVTGLNYEPIEGQYMVVKGVEIFPTPGHSPGHQSLLVRLDKTGNLILTGDAAPYKETIETYALVGVCPDPVAFVRSITKIKQIAKIEKAMIIHQHDPEQYETLKKPPQYYD